MEHSEGPLVDGRPYADQSFLDSLNDYHLSAARAHHDHSQDQLKLPVAAGAAAAISPWAVIVTDDPPGLNGHNPEGS
jgi:hypothetical protein